MKNYLLTLIGCLFVIFSQTSLARDTHHDFPINDALQTENAKDKLGGNIKFYFGDQKHGPVKKRYGVFSTNKKTNAFGKSDREACEHVFLSAMIQLKQRAESLGGNAVINIKSNYKGNLTSSNTTFKCGAGAVIAGVALQGEVVKLK
ncbi:MAG: excinuclease ABC subunit A [Thioalkalispiraceae bacterium]